MTVSKEEFTKMIDTVGDNLVFAYLHVQLHKKLSSPENLAKFSISPVFWGLTIAAHNQVGILRLCRAYEQNTDSSVGLLKILNVIECNFRYWDSPAPLDREQLKLDQELVNDKKCKIVNKLITLRDKVIAHPDKSKVLFRIKAVDQYKGKTITPAEYAKLQQMIDEEILYDVDEEGYKVGSKSLTWKDVQLLIDRGI